MRQYLCLIVALFVFMAPFTASAGEPARTVRLISTIGPVNSGLVRALADAFTEVYGIEVLFEGLGTGAALEKARQGHADIVLVHARRLEDQFIAEGYGIDRRDLMYNDYVLLGPAGDPANARGRADVAEALRSIAEGGHLFVTRGDRSGTHMAELELWQAAGVDVGNGTEGWYVVCPDGAKGNGPTARYADAKNAYVLLERATWLTLKEDVGLELLVQGDSRMKNFMAVIRVHPERFTGLHVDEAYKFADWLVSRPAQEIILAFGTEKFGEPMFFPNSDIWRGKRTQFSGPCGVLLDLPKEQPE